MEQATVKLPAANRMIKLILWRVSICSRMNSGICMRKVTTSHTMVMDAVAYRMSALKRGLERCNTYIPCRVVRQTMALDPRLPAFLNGTTLEDDDQCRCEVADDDDEDEVIDKSRNPTHVLHAVCTLEESSISKACTHFVVADC